MEDNSYSNNTNVRSRALASEGWKVIRYSGTEINRLNEKKSKEVMTEIFDI